MIRAIENQCLIDLREYFTRIGKKLSLLKPSQLHWEFELKLYQIDIPNATLLEVIKASYPDTSPEKATVIRTTFQGFTENLDYWFTTDRSGSPARAWLIRGDKSFAHLVDACVSISESRFYDYHSSPGDGLCNGLLGGWAVIILNPSQQRVLFLSGGEWD